MTPVAAQVSITTIIPMLTAIANRPDIEQELIDKVSTLPHQSLWGLCADLGNALSTEEIDLARSEEWASFPREDI